jgi:hypothetical protein
MEILAASGTGFGTGSLVPEPGRVSFTSVLIRQIRRCLRNKEEIGIKWLHAHLWDDKTQPSLTGKLISFERIRSKEMLIFR